MGRKGKAVVLDHGRLLRQTREMNTKIERERKKGNDSLRTNIVALQNTVASLAKEIKHASRNHSRRASSIETVQLTTLLLLFHTGRAPQEYERN